MTLNSVLGTEPFADQDRAPVPVNGTNNTIMLHLIGGLSEQDVTSVLHRFEDFSEVLFASPAVVARGVFHALTLDRFYMSFEVPFSEVELQDVLKAEGVEIIKRLQYPKLNRVGFFLRTTPAASTHALAISNRLYDALKGSSSLRPVTVGPDFYPLYDIMADSTPNDSNYASSCPAPDHHAYDVGCNLRAINLPAAWDITTGSEYLTVAVIDYGVDMDYSAIGGSPGHPELNPNQWINEAESLNGLDDDDNGFIDDIYGWNFNACETCGGCPGEGEGEGEGEAEWLPDCEDCLGLVVNEGWGPPNNPLGSRENEHGTFVAGIIAAAANNSAGMPGIAGGDCGGDDCDDPEDIHGVKIMPLVGSIDNFDENGCNLGHQDLCRVALAVRYAVENGANIINMSLGTFHEDAGLATEVENARANGVVMFAASHNFDNYSDATYDYDMVAYPAKYPEVIGVGAVGSANDPGETVRRKFGSVTTTDASNMEGLNPQPGPCIEWTYDPLEEPPCDCETQVAVWGSDYGPELDLMAPGLEILSLNFNCDSCWGAEYGEGYRLARKTSAATPQVAGVAALVMSATLNAQHKPTLTPTEVQAMLCLSADDLQYTIDVNNVVVEEAAAGRDIYTGWGQVNAGEAVALAQSPRFVIRNQEGKHAASFDIRGNLILEGVFLHVPPPGSSQIEIPVRSPWLEEFVVQADNYYPVLSISGGGTCVSLGKLYQSLPTSTVDLGSLPGKNVLIKNPDGDVMAAIMAERFTDSAIEPASPYMVLAGSILLRGRLFSGGDPDGDGIIWIN